MHSFPSVKQHEPFIARLVFVLTAYLSFLRMMTEGLCETAEAPELEPELILL